MFRPDALRLLAVAMPLLLVSNPTRAQFDTVINLPQDQVSISGSVGNASGAATPTVQLNVAEGGSIGNEFEAYSGSELNISGGSVGNNLGASFGSEINISGGTVGVFFYANSGSVVNISGGTIDSLFRANSGAEVNISGGTLGRDSEAESGSEVNISGGTVERRFNARTGSRVNVSGGTLGSEFEAESGSEVNISGGTVGRRFNAREGSDTELIGGEFTLNGGMFTDSTITLNPGEVFTGTLADGSVFIFENDNLVDVSLTTVTLPTLDTTPRFVGTDLSAEPSGIRAGQELILQKGGVLGDNFAAVDATLQIQDGMVGDYSEVAGSDVSISGGIVGRDFKASFGSRVEISGGTVDSLFEANSGSTVDITGGTVGGNFEASSGSQVNISGGTIDGSLGANESIIDISGGTVGSLNARFDTEVSISGGTVGSLNVVTGSVLSVSGGTVNGSFRALTGTEIHLVGTEFLLDGVLLDNLVPGEAFEVIDRGKAVLSGTLADGSPFELVLEGRSPNIGPDFFHPNATLTVTLVPEPRATTLLVGIVSSFLLSRRVARFCV